jgi:hypothetical protein
MSMVGPVRWRIGSIRSRPAFGIPPSVSKRRTPAPWLCGTVFGAAAVKR